MAIKKIYPMEFQLRVLDPFIVTFHHYDVFPKGNGKMGPLVMPKGKNNGNDFDPDANWRMYYGKQISGFPVHPHRGFETVTVMIEGMADHFDSKGSKGRYGEGDVQWMTAGAGVQHSEMFPMLNEQKENPMELFQIWLNLPQKDKFAKPDYKMLWSEEIPVVTETDSSGRTIQVKIIAGKYKDVKALEPTLASWAHDPGNHVGIWLITLDPQAEFTIPAVSKTLNRALYNYRGASIDIEGKVVGENYFAELQGDQEVRIKNGGNITHLLLLEGEPINEPVAARGPFVMNTMDELREAFADYNQTQFGGWPWEYDDPVNDKEAKRFASYDNGNRVIYPPQKKD